MSELTQTLPRGDFRWHLLTSVCALVLAAGPSRAANNDTSQPSVWIELGGQLQRVDGGEEPFAPPFVLTEPRRPLEVVSPVEAQHLPRYSYGGEGRLTFRPAGSDWQFAAAIVYGRSNGRKNISQEAVYSAPNPFAPSLPIVGAAYDEIKTKSSESHAVVDFQAGKDVGLGLLGRHSESTLNVGVRFAQFETASSLALKSAPEPYIAGSFSGFHFYLPNQHRFLAAASAHRSFRGLGPSLSWNGSAAIAGQPEKEVTFDWGANVAVLFGRQRAQTEHNASGFYHTLAMFDPGQIVLYSDRPDPRRSSRFVVVPNVGGFAGVSMKFSNAKVGLGYRGDFFFGVMDGGIDARDSRDRFFHGPFATISIGLGG
jgi:hypothetical protein